MPPHEYWIKFPNRQPFKMVCRDFIEFLERLKFEVEQHRAPFDWLVRE